MNKPTEEEMIELRYEVLTLKSIIKNMKARIENEFLDSILCGLQRKEISKLKDEIKQLKKENNRGAGRRKKFTDAEEEMIRRTKNSGKTVREVSEIYNCSVGLVHKLIKN